MADLTPEQIEQIGELYHLHVKTLYQGELARVVYGSHRREEVSWNVYSKGWHRNHGPARWINAAVEIGEDGMLHIETSRGRSIIVPAHETIIALFALDSGDPESLKDALVGLDSVGLWNHEVATAVRKALKEQGYTVRKQAKKGYGAKKNPRPGSIDAVQILTRKEARQVLDEAGFEDEPLPQIGWLIHLDETHWLENAGGQFELVDFSLLTAPWMQRMKPPYPKPPYRNPGGLQHRTARTRQDVLFETGTPVTFRAMRNTAPSVYMGSQFGQDIEPAGTFMLVDDYDAWNDPGAQVGGWVFFVQRFTSPLVIAMVADDDPMAPIYGPTGWKQRLSEAYGGATGVELSEAILASGHDGVVTVGPAPNDVREVVDLTKLPRSAAHRAKKNPPAGDWRGERG
jgi:hypothetical protein